MKPSHEMRYLMQNPNCGCDYVEHGRRIGIQYRIIGHFFETSVY